MCTSQLLKVCYTQGYRYHTPGPVPDLSTQRIGGIVARQS